MLSRRTYIVVRLAIAIVFLSLPALALLSLGAQSTRPVIDLISTQSGFLQGAAVLVTLAAFSIGAFRRLTGQWIGKRFESLEVNPTEPLSANELLSNIDQEIVWVHRNITRLDDLIKRKRLLLLGDGGVGKTREAYELMNQAIGFGIVNTTDIYRPSSYALATLTIPELNIWVRSNMQDAKSILLVVNDLHHWFSVDLLNRLGELIHILEMRTTDLFIIATMRVEPYNELYAIWFATFGFTERRIHPFSELPQIVTLVNDVANKLGVSIGMEGAAALAELSEGIPESILAVLLSFRKTTSIPNQEDVRNKVAAHVWNESRESIKQIDVLAWYILNASAAFFAAGLRARRNLVTAYACEQWIAESRSIARIKSVLTLIFSRKRTERAIKVLEDYNISVKRDFVVKEAALEYFDELSSQRKLAHWFSNQSSTYGRLKLKLLYDALDDYFGSLLLLEFKFRKNRDTGPADRNLQKRLAGQKNQLLKHVFSQLLSEGDLSSYFPSTRVILIEQAKFPGKGPYVILGTPGNSKDLSPRIGSFRHLGYKFSASGKAAETCVEGLREVWRSRKHYALMEYTRAQREDPTSYLPYYMIGSLYYAADDSSAALQAFEQCLEREPGFVLAHYWLAEIHRELGNVNTALDHLHHVKDSKESIVAGALLETRIHLERDDDSSAKKVLDDLVSRVMFLHGGDIFQIGVARARLETIDSDLTETRINTILQRFGLSQYTKEVLQTPTAVILMTRYDDRLSSTDAATYMVARWCMQIKEFGTAEPLLRYVIDSNRDEMSSYSYLLAEAYRRQMKPELAVQVCQEALKKRIYTAFQTQIELAASLKDMGNQEGFEAKLSLARGMLQLESPYFVACYYALRGNYKAAVQALQALAVNRRLSLEDYTSHIDMQSLITLPAYQPRLSKEL